LRGKRALHALLGLDRFPPDDTIRNRFRAFGVGQFQPSTNPLAEWQTQRLPRREKGYTLELDSTVFERYGSSRDTTHTNTEGPATIRCRHVLSAAHFLRHG